ncbi:MAG TPA: hypothetical protein VI259_11770, partial [Gemmatimonadaceae bacterium]
ERLRRNFEQIRLGNAMEFGLQLSSARRLRTERIDLKGQMAVALNGHGKCRRGGGFSEQGCIVPGGRSCTPTTQPFGKPKKLAPGLVDR